MSAAIHDIVVDQGATFEFVVGLEDGLGQAYDLTGASARMQGRSTVGAGTTLFSLTTASGITIDEAAGVVTVTISDTATAALDFETGVYDLEVEEADGTVLRILQGVVTLSREVTR